LAGEKGTRQSIGLATICTPSAPMSGKIVMEQLYGWLLRTNVVVAQGQVRIRQPLECLRPNASDKKL
jgi:hypothetical protein